MHNFNRPNLDGTNMTKNRSRRLRKKLHVGEFLELGFNLSFTMNKDMSTEAMDAFVDRFLTEAIYGQGLFFGGGIGEMTEGFVSKHRGTATEAHRQYIETWLIKQRDVFSAEIGDLTNAWQQKRQPKLPFLLHLKNLGFWCNSHCNIYNNIVMQCD